MADNKPEPPYKDERERVLCQRIEKLAQEIIKLEARNRKRKSVFQFRVSDIELDKLKAEAESAGMNASDYVRYKLGWDVAS